MYGFSKRKQVPGEYLSTYACNPHNERYDDYPPSILEKGPSPPNDDKIAEPYLQQAQIDTESDSDSLILTGTYDAQKATRIMLHDTLSTNLNPGFDIGISDSGRSVSGLRGGWMTLINAATAIPVFKVKRRRLMTVVANMAVVARLENPRRL